MGAAFTFTRRERLWERYKHLIISVLFLKQVRHYHNSFID